MTRYTLIDFNEYIIYDLENLEDFEENDEKISRVYCNARKDLIKELKVWLDYLENLEEEYLQEVQSKYDEYLMKTENRGISYGELAYLQSLDEKELEEFEEELWNNTQEKI